MSFNGPGAYKARITYQRDDGSVVRFVDHSGGDCELHEATRYKHLGSQIVVGGSQHPEIISRFASMKAKYRKVRRKIVKAKNVPVAKKVVVARSYLLSKALYNAGTWSDLKTGEARTVHAGTMMVYRGLIRQDEGKSGQHRMTDQQVIDEIDTFSPLNLVALEKISTFIRIVRKQPPQLMLALAHGHYMQSDGRAHPKANGWLASVERTLNKIADHSDKLAELRGSTIAQWFAFIAANGKVNTEYFQKICKHESINGVCFWWPVGARRQAEEGLQWEMGDDPMTFTCEECDKCTSTIQALNWHYWQVHNRKHPIRWLMGSDTICLCCMKDFYSRARLVTHLIQSAPKCKRYYEGTQDPIGGGVYDALEDAEIESTRALLRGGHRRTYAVHRPDRVQGPLHPYAMLCLTT